MSARRPVRAPAQVAGAEVGAVAGGGQRLLDPAAVPRLDERVAVHDVRDGLHGHAGERGDVLERDRHPTSRAGDRGNGRTSEPWCSPGRAWTASWLRSGRVLAPG